MDIRANQQLSHRVVFKLEFRMFDFASVKLKAEIYQKLKAITGAGSIACQQDFCRS
jgi:hypothetical protein